MLSTYVDTRELSTMVDGPDGGSGTSARSLVTLRPLWGGGDDAYLCSAAAAVPVHPGLGEAVRQAAVCEHAGLLGGPAVAGQARGAWPGQPFDSHQAAAGRQDPPGLVQAGVQVGPMVGGGDRPGDRYR